ncbi:MAG: enoyl-CoA hydratase/isomerase family protein [Marinifilaceae bacterium]|jgi:enoyl-CoA hydratase/carnithine racemase
MQKSQDLNYQCEYFSAKQIDEILVFQPEGDIIYNSTFFECRDLLLEFYDRIEASREVKVVVMKGMPTKPQKEQYKQFFEMIGKDNFNETTLLRMYRAFDQFILKLVRLNKIVIAMDQEEFIPLLFNLRMACDFRVISDDVKLTNVAMELGMVPKGGSMLFFHERQGLGNPLKYMLFERDLDSTQMLERNLVDWVFPKEELEERTMELARQLIKIPASTLSGSKKLMNHSLDQLEEYLQFENKILVQCFREMHNEGKIVQELKRLQ